MVAALEAVIMRKAPQKSRPKMKLGIPDLEHSKAGVLRSLRSPDSRRGYQHAIDEFVAWYCSEPRLSFNKPVVLRYRIYLEDRGLSAGTINVRLPAVRRLAFEAADCGLLSPELAAGVQRVSSPAGRASNLFSWYSKYEPNEFGLARDPRLTEDRFQVEPGCLGSYSHQFSGSGNVAPSSD